MNFVPIDYDKKAEEIAEKLSAQLKDIAIKYGLPASTFANSPELGSVFMGNVANQDQKTILEKAVEVFKKRIVDLERPTPISEEEEAIAKAKEEAEW